MVHPVILQHLNRSIRTIANSSTEGPTVQFPFTYNERAIYVVVVFALVALCAWSLTANLKIVMSLMWVRRPMTATLSISASLAAADGYTAACMGLGLLINSLLPTISIRTANSNCPLLVFEGIRLGGIIMTVLHLLVLAITHFIGIVYPLKNLALMTRRLTTCVLVSLWIAPTAFFFAYFGLIPDDGFQHADCGYMFLKYWHFRFIFSCIFLCPFIAMVLIYGRIYYAVRLHFLFIRRNGGVNDNLEEQILTAHVKALNTTLLILGSYVAGWAPGTLHFLTVCNDCVFDMNYFKPEVTFVICVITNLFIILKTLCNPIIYASRMSEIRRAQVIMDRKWSEMLRRWRRRVMNEPEVQSGDEVEMSITRRQSRNPQVTSNPTVSAVISSEPPPYDSQGYNDNHEQQTIVNHI